MTNSKSDTTDVAEALQSLSNAMSQLQTSYAAAQRTNLLLKLLLVAFLLVSIAGAYIGVKQTLAPVHNALGQIAHRLNLTRDPSADAMRREELFAKLTPEQREHVERFERQHQWVADYIRTNPEFNAGAAIALFLSDMANSVNVMPDMHADVRAMTNEVRDMTQEVRVMVGAVQGMNAKMDALPVLAAEVQGLHRQVAIMAADMDSTMGRAGRMMPWMP